MMGYNVYTDDKAEELRSAIEEAEDEEDEEDENEDKPEPNYECPHCLTEYFIDDHKRNAPAWCTFCERMQTFKRIDDDQNN